MSRSLICLCLLISTALGCDALDDDERAERVLVPAGPAICDGGPERPEALHTPLVAALGASPNVLKERDGALWVVQSSENTIGRYDLRTGAWSRDFIDVGNDQNPYDMEIDGGRAFIANYLGNSVTVADAATGAVLDVWTSDALKQPSGVAVTARHVYVSSVELRAPGDFGPGSVTIFERATGREVATLPAAAPNPQFISRIVAPDGVERVVVVSTGGLRVAGGEATLITDGAVDVWRETDDPKAPERLTLSVPRDPRDLQRGGLGAPQVTPDGRSWYFGSATSALLFKLDARDWRWERGPSNPIRFAARAPRSLHHIGMGADGLLAITSFNEDALYLWDTSCDALLAGPLPLGLNSSLLEGPHGVVSVKQGDDATLWYITSLSNALGSVKLRDGAL